MKLLVRDTVTNESVTVLLQQQMNYGAKAVYTEEPVRGTSDPHLGYSHTEGQTVTFNGMVCSSLEEGDARTPGDVIQDLAWLQSLCYPEALDTALRPPHKVVLSMVPLINPGLNSTDFPALSEICAARSWTGYLTDMQVEEFGGYDIETGYPLHARVTLNLRVVGPRLAGVRWVG